MCYDYPAIMFQIHVVLKIMILAIIVFSLLSHLSVFVCSSLCSWVGLISGSHLWSVILCWTLASSALCVCAASGFSSPSAG